MVEIFSKLEIVQIICRPPSQKNFLELLIINLNKIKSVDNEIYVLGEFKINLFLNDSYVLEKKYLKQQVSSM